jgi:hypothetical protein
MHTLCSYIGIYYNVYEGHRKVSWDMHPVGCIFDRPVLI